MIADVERDALGLLRDAGIARRADEPVGERACRHLPGQRVLASTGAQKQNIHGAKHGRSARSTAARRRNVGREAPRGLDHAQRPFVY